MYSSNDFERLFIRYKAESVPSGESIMSFCNRNKVPYNLFEKWYKDTRHKLVPVQVEGRPSVEDSVMEETPSDQNERPACVRMMVDIRMTRILFIDQSMNSEIKEQLEGLNNWTVHRLPKSNFIIGEQLYIYKALRYLHIDVYWAPYNTFPLCKPKALKYLVTVHDLIFMDKISKKASFRQKVGALYRRYVLQYGLNKVDHFFTVSEYTKAQMRERLSLSSDRVSVSYNCISNFINKIDVIKQSNIKKGNYYFTLSGDAPNKNLPFVLDYFKKNPDKYLLIGGVESHSSLRNRIFENVEFLPFGVDDNTIIRHYLACKGFLFLSLKEGFGIPVLEAMACNCRMLLSGTTSIPEIAGDCALYADPTDYDSFEQGMERLENFNPNIDDIQKRLERFFNWSCSADVVYRSIQDSIYK